MLAYGTLDLLAVAFMLFLGILSVIACALPGERDGDDHEGNR